MRIDIDGDLDEVKNALLKFRKALAKHKETFPVGNNETNLYELTGLTPNDIHIILGLFPSDNPNHRDKDVFLMGACAAWYWITTRGTDIERLAKEATS